VQHSSQIAQSEPLRIDSREAWSLRPRSKGEGYVTASRSRRQRAAGTSWRIVRRLARNRSPLVIGLFRPTRRAHVKRRHSRSSSGACDSFGCSSTTRSPISGDTRSRLTVIPCHDLPATARGPRPPPHHEAREHPSGEARIVLNMQGTGQMLRRVPHRAGFRRPAVSRFPRNDRDQESSRRSTYPPDTGVNHHRRSVVDAGRGGRIRL
jgi:hypothetical protein